MGEACTFNFSGITLNIRKSPRRLTFTVDSDLVGSDSSISMVSKVIVP